MYAVYSKAHLLGRKLPVDSFKLFDLQASDLVCDGTSKAQARVRSIKKDFNHPRMMFGGTGSQTLTTESFMCLVKKKMIMNELHSWCDLTSLILKEYIVPTSVADFLRHAAEGDTDYIIKNVNSLDYGHKDVAIGMAAILLLEKDCFDCALFLLTEFQCADSASEEDFVKVSILKIFAAHLAIEKNALDAVKVIIEYFERISTDLHAPVDFMYHIMIQMLAARHSSDKVVEYLISRIEFIPATDTLPNPKEVQNWLCACIRKDEEAIRDMTWYRDKHKGHREILNGTLYRAFQLGNISVLRALRYGCVSYMALEGDEQAVVRQGANMFDGLFKELQELISRGDIKDISKDTLAFFESLADDAVEKD